MQPFLGESYGNPSSLHSKGREADQGLIQVRGDVAKVLNCRSSEVIFTAGGTESINLAILGTARAYEYSNFSSPLRGEGRVRVRKPGHIITTVIEHHAVLRPIEALAEHGWSITYLKVDREGFINLADLKKAIRKDTVLVSIMYANNEVGTVQNIAQIGKKLKAENVKRKAKKLHPIYFHTDACQAAGSLNLDVNKLGVDLLSLNGSKIYGPKQTGVLYVRQGTQLLPIIYGGGQERNLRSGTENVAGFVGLAKALTLAKKSRVVENERLMKLRDYFYKEIKKSMPGVTLNGPNPLSLNPSPSRGEGRVRVRVNRLPNNLNVSFTGVEGESLMLYLDSYGICVSTGSACTTKSVDPSHVLLALGRSKQEVLGSIRFSLGKATTKKDLDYVLKILPQLVAELRRIKKLN